MLRIDRRMLAGPDSFFVDRKAHHIKQVQPNGWLPQAAGGRGQGRESGVNSAIGYSGLKVCGQNRGLPRIIDQRERRVRCPEGITKPICATRHGQSEIEAGKIDRRLRIDGLPQLVEGLLSRAQNVWARCKPAAR